MPTTAGRFAEVRVGDEDVTEAVQGAEVDAAVSAIARVPELRAVLLERQRRIAAEGRIIMAGRDIGTVVLPDAGLKLFLDASTEERARRRAEERGLEPDGSGAAAILEGLRARDELDTTRPVAPLRAAPDADPPAHGRERPRDDRRARGRRRPAPGSRAGRAGTCRRRTSLAADGWIPRRSRRG